MTSNTPADSFILHIEPPVTVKGGGTCDSIVLREPRAKHVRDAEKKLDAKMSEQSVSDYCMDLIRACGGVDKEVVNALTTRQAGQAMAYLQAFVGNSYEDMDSEPLDDMPEDVQVPIDPPVVWQGVKYDTLNLREPTIGEKRQSEGFTRQGITPYSVRARDMELLKLVTGVHPAIIEALPIRTQVEATRQLARFIEAGRRVGVP